MMLPDERKQCNTLKPNLDLGILVGMLLTDGCLSKNGNSYDIEFTNKSDELHRLFKQQMKKLFNVSNFTEISDSRFKEIRRTKIKNKQIGEALLDVVPTFRTKKFIDGSFPKSSLPKFFYEMSDESLCKILQTIFSTDGSVSLWPVWNKRKSVWEIKKLVKISCAHTAIRKQYFQLLKKLDFSPTLREINNEVVLFKKQDLIKFKKEIRFVNGVKITGDSRHWEGFEKNQILNLAIRSFKLKKKDLKNFKSKEEIINFLKSMVSASISD